MVYQFDADEQNYLNHCAAGTGKDAFLSHLNFNIMVSPDDTHPFLTGIRDKITGFTDEQWNMLQEELPFMTAYGDSDSKDYVDYVKEND